MVTERQQKRAANLSIRRPFNEPLVKPQMRLDIGAGDILDSENLSVRSAQSVDNRSQTQSGHDLVAEVLSLTAGQTVNIVQTGESAVVAEQLHAVVAPVAAEHGAQSSIDQALSEAVADQSDNVGGELLDVGSSPLLPSNEKNEYDRSPPGCATGKTYATECALGNITN